MRATSLLLFAVVINVVVARRCVGSNDWLIYATGTDDWPTYTTCHVTTEWKRHANFSYPCAVEGPGGSTDRVVLFFQGPGTVTVIPQLTGLTRIKMTASVYLSAEANASCPFWTSVDKDAYLTLNETQRLNDTAVSLELPDNLPYLIGVVGWQYGYTEYAASFIIGSKNASFAYTDYYVLGRVQLDASAWMWNARHEGFRPRSVDWGWTSNLGTDLAGHNRLQFAYRACTTPDATTGHCPVPCSCPIDRVCMIDTGACACSYYPFFCDPTQCVNYFSQLPPLIGGCPSSTTTAASSSTDAPSTTSGAAVVLYLASSLVVLCLASTSFDLV